MKTISKISINKPANTFGSVRTETEITFPAHRLTVAEAKEFLEELKRAINEAN